MTKKCIWCGQEIQTTSSNRKFCDVCRVLRDMEIHQKSDRKRRKKRSRVFVVQPIPKKSISDIVKDILAYNKKHGTHLTYGQYVGKLYTGTLKV